MSPGNEAAPTFDRSQFEALFTRLEKPVFNVVYRWVWNAEEARDVTQEAFMKLWTARHRVRFETVEPLLFQSAVNLAANRLRARKVRRRFTFGGEEVVGGPDQSLEERQRDVAVRKAVEALPEKLKAVVMLCEFSGMTTAQIAEALKIPPGTVSSRRSLAMATLEKSLEGAR
ncbi:MAG: RNA polymerase sigma factor [Archangium sp.]